jgi:hypothetical protein
LWFSTHALHSVEEQSVIGKQRSVISPLFPPSRRVKPQSTLGLGCPVARNTGRLKNGFDVSPEIHGGGLSITSLVEGDAPEKRKERTDPLPKGFHMKIMPKFKEFR